MIIQTIFISAILVIGYAVAKWQKLSVELSLFISTLAGVLAGAIFRTPALGEIPRHLLEGSFTYLDVILVFFSATLFITIIQNQVELIMRSDKQ
jgi:CitMHS family citrate-Mg2+:H+ or citrate-Ca2+:H+ symporter